MLTKWIILFVSVCILNTQSNAIILNDNLLQNYDDMIEVLKKTTEKIFAQHHCIIVNIISAVTDEQNVHYQELKTEILNYLFTKGTRDVRIVNSRENMSDSFRRYCSIFLVDSTESFCGIYPQITSTKFKFHGVYMLMILDKNEVNLQEIFSMMWKKAIYNVYGIYEENKTVSLTTFFPFKQGMKCGNSVPVIINKYYNKQFEEDLKIPKKLSNLYGCPIKVTAFRQNIAVIREIQSDGSIKFHGHEMTLIKTLSKKLNFSLVIQFRDGFEQWGNVYENGTATKALAEVINKTTDIAIGDFFLKPTRIKFLDSSCSFLNYPVLLIVPKGEKLTAMEKLMRPFEPFVWMLLLISFLVGSTVIYVINYKVKKLKPFIFGYKVTQPLLNMLVVILGSQQKKLPKKNFARFILMMFIILCLVLRSIYQGSLYKFLQSDGRHKEVETLQEMIEKNFTFLTHDFYFDIINENPDVKKLSKDVHGHDSETVPIKQKSATFSSRTTLIRYSLDHKESSFKICKEHFMTVNIVFYYPKNFYLREELDLQIGKIISAGLVEHWISKYDNTHYWNIQSNQNPTVMKIDHLIGSFYIFAFGLFCATFAFFIELIFDNN
ncbi:hypothetical protein PVAND_010774 [Polypedilum vanderplanki]|uniref:Ionotropic receptor n=1 Tax=Polypedilum vanderplanki TaxID=319348 RepID=A0A9J6CHI0_POLVA|nr:hypothetical protein PVAND_010774 [Polypedilum vanderplanki]